MNIAFNLVSLVQPGLMISNFIINLRDFDEWKGSVKQKNQQHDNQQRSFAWCNFVRSYLVAVAAIAVHSNTTMSTKAKLGCIVLVASADRLVTLLLTRVSEYFLDKLENS